MGAPLSHWKSVDALDSGGRIPPLVFAFLRGIVRVNLECRLIELLVRVTRQKLTAGLRIAHVHFDSCLVKQLTRVKCRNWRERLCTRYLCALRPFVFPMGRTTANNDHWETGTTVGEAVLAEPRGKATAATDWSYDDQVDFRSVHAKMWPTEIYSLEFSEVLFWCTLWKIQASDITYATSISVTEFMTLDVLKWTGII